LSNVLIGVIGVILFIGLALAGALFLGSRFKDAKAQSEAAAYMTQLKQISDATSMYNLKTGQYLPHLGDGISVLVARRMLKSPPAGFDFSELDGASNAQIVFKAVPDTAANRSVCEYIQRQTNQISQGQAFDARPINMRYTTTDQGCIVWSFRRNTLSIYAKI
jgi:hypothetical protein